MIQINNDWSFAKLPGINIADIENMEQLDLSSIQMQGVTIPHTWYEDGNAYEGAVIYTKMQEVNVLPSKRVFLQFEAADRWCRVYVNHTFAGEHKGGYSAFAFDITELCQDGKENEIFVLLDNRSWETISPLAGDFTVFGGIYRNVNLIETGKSCFDRTYYGTDGVIVCTDLDNNQDGMIDLSVHLLGDEKEEVTLRSTCIEAAGNVVLSNDSRVEKNISQESSKEEFAHFEYHHQLVINQPELWNGFEEPNMYSLVVELLKDGVVIDRTEKQIGFKKVRIDAQTGFYLNDRSMKINGVAKHQDFAGVFNATDEQNWKKDLSDILDIGANSVRLSHYQHPQKMYELCDKTGLVVWAEIPFLKINESEEFFENACQQLRELILQNIHHPSICFWGVQNEIAMFAENETTYEQVKGLDAIVKELDQTRISAGANLFCVDNDSQLNKITDAVGYNIYYGWYYGEMKDNDTFVEQFHKDNPDIPLGITEYGVDCNLKFHNGNPKVKDYSEEFQALYHETVYPIFASKSYIWGTYVWNLYDFSSGIRDEGGVKYKNCKGLVSYDRQTKKDAYYYYKAQWSDQAFVRIAERRFKNRAEQQIQVKVYSNQPEVTLEINGINYTAQSETGVFTFDQVPLQSGDNMVTATAGACSDSVKFTQVAEADQSYLYVDANPGLNVKNWFLDALEEEKLFPKGKYSIRVSCKDLLESDEAMQVIEEFNAGLAEGMRERKGMMPLERILNYMKKEVTEEQCKELNHKLTQIDKL